MKIFVTGASGYIGSAVASALARAGHDVLGLVRTSSKAPELARSEVEPLVANLDAPASWRERARECQVLVHTAAEYTPRNAELDRATVKELTALGGRGGNSSLFVYTSGVWVFGDTAGRMVDESSPRNPPPTAAPRAVTEELVLAANSPTMRTLIVRPGCVYGASGSLTASWFESATKEGGARIVGEGANRWAMIHRDDLAEFYVRAVESRAAGEVFNATDRSRNSVRECASAASRAAGANGKVLPTSIADATKTYGPMATCLALDQHIDSSKAVRMLGWQPRHAGFVDEAPRLFRAWRASQS